ncbi:cysteine desulfurase family protein [Bartonella tamiae]|uniref:Cysteine desulfurase n=1 Tax=Bartonella tamiae Th239 TaxID=1094558 RepID=J0QSP0_9HYPH|nr:cysteine desulfurase family protein [Bartonella tamiae]EJF88886.1 hypothetical protein ME5_01437 [Bartonella tamiae Th239]EJF94864.1 hypothetical protein MEG_00445 [Bartonella tamiae Th307]
MSLQRCYLDFNATTPLSDEARLTLIEALDLFGNPSSVHQEGRASKALLQKARRQIADRLKTRPDNVVFTSGASEAAMTLLTPHFKMGRNDVFFSHLYIGSTEHPCIYEGGRFAVNDRTYIKVDQEGLINKIDLIQKLENHDKSKGLPLVAIQAANGETGVLQPIKEMAQIVQKSGGVLIVDLVQYIGKSSVDINEFGGDFFILAAHKIGGPKGVGAFVSKGEMLMPIPLIVAGGQERGFRSGTEALPLIASFGEAMAKEPSDDEYKKALNLRHHLESKLRALSNDVTIIADNTPRLPNTTYFFVSDIKAETLQIGLDLAGFSVSAGSACSSGKVKQSSVLTAMGLEIAEGAIRVSTGWTTNLRDIDRFIETVEKLIVHKKIKKTT